MSGDICQSLKVYKKKKYNCHMLQYERRKTYKSARLTSLSYRLRMQNKSWNLHFISVFTDLDTGRSHHGSLLVQGHAGQLSPEHGKSLGKKGDRPFQSRLLSLMAIKFIWYDTLKINLIFFYFNRNISLIEFPGRLFLSLNGGNLSKRYKQTKISHSSIF